MIDKKIFSKVISCLTVLLMNRSLWDNNI